MRSTMGVKAVSIVLMLSLVMPLTMVGCGKSSKAATETEISDASSGQVENVVNDLNQKQETVKEEELELAEQAKEDQIKAEEEAKKAEEEEAKKAEEEQIKEEEEEARKAEEERIKAEEEEEKKAEEERLKAEEEAKKAEEERLKAEEEAKKAEEERLREEEERAKKEAIEKNSFSMMYYLAITAEDIRTSKDNRLILDDIYTSLLNDINPGAIDEITQDHLNNLRDVIKSYRNISTKRDRLQYIYNQNKAAAMRSAVPNPLAVLSMAQTLDWKRLAVSAVYTVVDSCSNYKNANENADKEFLMSGWELDDEELETIQKNRERAFNYMVDMVQAYDLDGLKTLSERDIQNFSQICAIEFPTEKIKRLKAEEKKYELLGNYWLELADCYFENAQYSLCLECVNKYLDLSSGIYKQDSKIVQILPKAIVAAQNTYKDEKYVSVIDDYAKRILDNTSSDEWSTRYFVAQSYIDLYSKTNNKQYLRSAYRIISENVTILLNGQREINATYLAEVKEETIVNPKDTQEYKYLSKEQQKQNNKEYDEEKKRLKEYNNQLKETRKTERISMYEPLVLNCELLFALADKVDLSLSEKEEINDILKNNIFLVKPIEDAYSFGRSNYDYDITISKNEIVIPASLLTAEASIEISVEDNSGVTTINDSEVTSVKREGKTIDTFSVHISGKQWKKIEWNENSHVTVKIVYSDVYNKELVLKYRVSKYEKKIWPWVCKVEFEKE